MRKSPQPLTNFGQGYYISNQLGRRNLNPNQIAYLRGKRFESEKKMRGGDGSNQYSKEQIAQNGPLAGDTAQRIADEYGIGRNTVKRAEKFAKVVDLLPEEARKNILDGSESIKQKESEAILKMDKPTQKKFLKEKNGITFLTIWQRNFPLRNRIMLFYFNLNISAAIGALNESISFSLIFEQVKQINFEGVGNLLETVQPGRTVYLLT